MVGEERDVNLTVPVDYDSFLESLETFFPDDEIDACLLFETSRGCWWGERSHCTFCGINGLAMKFRVMAPETAVEYFDGLFRYAPRAPYLLGVDHILSQNYLTEVLPFMDTPTEMTIFYEVKANLGETFRGGIRISRARSVVKRRPRGRHRGGRGSAAAGERA